jgi:hypothetical protein
MSDTSCLRQRAGSATFNVSPSPYFLSDIMEIYSPRQVQFLKVHDKEAHQGSDSVFYSLI